LITEEQKQDVVDAVHTFSAWLLLFGRPPEMDTREKMDAFFIRCAASKCGMDEGDANKSDEIRALIERGMELAKHEFLEREQTISLAT